LDAATRAFMEPRFSHDFSRVPAHPTTPIQTRNNTGLPDALKSGIENLSGLSMDDVRVHYNSSEPSRLQALAYTRGAGIHIAPGQERYLAHEAWHVVQQQRGRVKPTVQAKGVAINDDAELEREADVMGMEALRVGRALSQSPSDAAQNEAQTAGLASGSRFGESDGVIQGKFVSLTEERILHIQAEAKKKG